MHKSDPLNLPHTDLELDMAFSRSSEPDNAPAQDCVIRHVAVVGALFDGSKQLLGFQDPMTIREALNKLKAARVTLAPLMHFHFYNLLAPLKSDFLKAALIDRTAPKADLLILCGIPGTHRRRVIDVMPLYQQEAVYRDARELYEPSFDFNILNRQLSISAMQIDAKSWPAAAHAIGAKLVVIDGSADDLDHVNTNYFTQGNIYRPLATSREHLDKDLRPDTGGYGILVHKDAIDALKPMMQKDHLLGRRLHSLAP